MTAKNLLNAAQKAKEDEFYTQLDDIDIEIKHYHHHFKNKVVYCNCDDPRVSNFFHYFSHQFEILELKKLITTCYKNDNPDLFSFHNQKKAVYLEYFGDKNNNKLPDDDEITVMPLRGDGDFRSEECVEMLKQADIVVTNPPFSLFREYVAQLIKYQKKFLIIGNMNAVTYKEIFPLVKENKMWLGHNSGKMAFRIPEHYPPRKSRYWVDETGQKWRSMGNTCWFTNLDLKKRHDNLVLVKTYNKTEYPYYDNCDVINVDKVSDIPKDWDGVMGVPITFLEKYNPDQFEILGLANSARWIGYECYTCIGEKKIYNRIIIRNRNKVLQS